MTPPGPATRQLDVTAEVCPMTFARVRLALEDMAPGEVLEVTLSGDETLLDVACACEEYGHPVLERRTLGDQRWCLRIRRGERDEG